MTQEEFKKGLIELKEARRIALSSIDYLLDDVNRRHQMLKHEISELHKRQAMIRMERSGLERKHAQVNNLWKDKIKAYYDANVSTSSKLEDVSDWCIVEELHRRGYRADLQNSERDAEWLQNLNNKLNRVTPPTSSDEQHETTE